MKQFAPLLLAPHQPTDSYAPWSKLYIHAKHVYPRHISRHPSAVSCPGDLCDGGTTICHLRSNRHWPLGLDTTDTIMKFAREYEATLEQEQYPQHWVQSSISYRQLKKCIRKVQVELSQLGLDADAVKRLLRSAGSAEGKAMPLTGTAASLPPLPECLRFSRLCHSR